MNSTNWGWYVVGAVILWFVLFAPKSPKRVSTPLASSSYIAPSLHETPVYPSQAAAYPTSRPHAYPSAGAQFNGYPCTDDCSGHEAGYDWAERNDIEDTSDCTGNSNSFVEGCESYAEEKETEAQALAEEEDQEAEGGAEE